jgi:tetratricopeptide (TPR) repeat protein
LGIILAGCQSGQLRDVNDERPLAASVAWRDLQSYGEGTHKRVRRDEISETEYQTLLRRRALELLERVDVPATPASEAWMLGHLYRTAERWAEAERTMEAAVKAAPNQDRRVNDTLVLAAVLGQQGKVDQAIARARSVFDAPPREKAPILPATLFEIVPAAQGKGSDRALADLVGEAIVQAMRTEVDPQSEAGKAFLAARPVHTRNALSLMEALYRASGDPGAYEKARQRLIHELGTSI